MKDWRAEGIKVYLTLTHNLGCMYVTAEISDMISKEGAMSCDCSRVQTEFKNFFKRMAFELDVSE